MCEPRMACSPSYFLTSSSLPHLTCITKLKACSPSNKTTGHFVMCEPRMACSPSYFLTSSSLPHLACITKLKACSPRHKGNRPCMCGRQGKSFQLTLT
ncbi:hypothetical protein TIFTF001_042354 [Ficus carica]|uniref:Uncharacterized protein n=1 Tax=Ficus carica TaxID=3494 RepID=A0AA88CXX3_FICCA|nr:hypothetical protein TIFTF001_042354 [Ficus carica]